MPNPVSRRVVLVLVTLALATAGPRSGRAWSGPGHQAVCQIAYLELPPAVRKKVAAIMARETSNAFKPFASACTWPDSQKKVKGTIQNQRRNDHFVNVDRSLASITSDSCGAATRCLFTAIASDEKIVGTGTGKKQLEALKFLGHWMGDLHQPLHISYEDDLGGNDIPVDTEPGCSEIHGVWDNCVPDALRKQLGANTGPTDFGTRLQKAITDVQRTEWRKGGVVEWAAESYAIAREADTGYCLLDGGKCCYDAKSCTFTGKETNRSRKLAGDYDAKHLDIVKERLQKAGVRLAAILEAQLK